MSDLNRILRTIYSKLKDEDDTTSPYAIYDACEDKAELVVACMDNLDPAQISRFFSSITALMFPDSKREMMLESWHIAEHFDPSDNRCAAIIVIAMNQYSYTDYLKELEYEKNCEDSESDNERNEYENQSMNRRV